ncbi:MAG: mandelate racemase/muconate lactonizing enzyme family protein [Aeromicrobium sp.]
MATAMNTGRQPIRIADITVILAGTSWRNITLVKITTDDGLIGWGDATVEYREFAVAGHLGFLRHLLVGLDALSPAAVWQKVIGDDFMAGDVVSLASASAVINACLDIAGQAYGVPVYRLLGGAIRDRIPVYANGWYRGERTPEIFANLALDVTRRGHRALKFDPFGATGILATPADIDEAANLIGAVRDSLGQGIGIAIDAHGRLAPSMARRTIDAFSEFGITFLEEPVAPHNLQAVRQLRSSSRIPIAAGERSIGRTGFKPLIEGECVDVIQPDASWAGGLIEVGRIAAWAELHGMVVALHNANSPLATLTACHVAATLPNFMMLETFDDFDEPWLRDAFPGAPVVTDGHLPIPTEPGIGIRPNEAILAEHPPLAVFMNINEPGWEFRRAVVET